MRICLYTETALPQVGGQEMVVDTLARTYQALGHEAVVLAPQPHSAYRARDEQLPYRVVRHPRFFSSRDFVSWYLVIFYCGCGRAGPVTFCTVMVCSLPAIWGH